MLKPLFDRFIMEKTYMENRTPKTLSFYKDCYKAFVKEVGEERMPTKEILNDFVVAVMKKGLSVGCFNTYVTGFNVFLNWLHRNGYVGEKLKLKTMKRPKIKLRSLDTEELERLIKFKPKDFIEKRMYVLLLTFLDTGARINELLSLTRENVNLGGLYITLYGKGRKERVVPMSVELRKVLYRWLQLHDRDLVFPSNQGTKMFYTNVYKAFERMCDSVGVKRMGFHTLRRTFARNYLRNGGNLFYLQSALGHERLETTRKYIEVELGDLQIMHSKTSILSRLK